ncbi:MULTISPECIES: hypothetical protein [Uliginosibacterium]|uniref:Uncharacterized protein n=1 Tax=Uliginosibacterium aquaticum TaxID=2731212 RepID=A0ABX2IHQ7_9RHOO|nr:MULTISPECIES: hypothetical protein [Uliginosibacterium]MDO6385911.1 hypothetical protein [Uliginosibacterium sp. 31-12]NSL54174.1 hypothetical protein [Uliginosibacterium aquaticum]
MSHKEQRGNKETKKPASHSMKEKRELKHAKKHARDTPVIVPPHSPH